VECLVRCCGGDAAASGEEPALYGLPRIEVVSALGRVAKPRDEGAVKAVAARLSDADAEVRLEAAAAMARLGRGNKQLAVREAGQLLQDRDFRVRGAAGKAIAQVCAGSAADSRAEEDAFRLAAAQLERRDWRARRGAASALRWLSENVRARQSKAVDGVAEVSTADPTKAALDALLPRLHHTDWSVRRKAVQAIAGVAEAVSGSTYAVELLATAIADPDEEVLIAVAASLPAAAPRKSKLAVALAIRLAGSSGRGPPAIPDPVKEGDEARPGTKDEESMSRAPSVASSRRPSVVGSRAPSIAPSKARSGMSKAPSKSPSKAPLKALSKANRQPSAQTKLDSLLSGALPFLGVAKGVAASQNEAIEAELTPVFIAPLEVRLKAIDAVEDLASEGRSRSRTAIHGIAELILDENIEVRNAAERALRTIGRGRRTAVDDLAKLLKHADPEIRASAARAFKGVASLKMKERALKRTMYLARHTDASVRTSASDAISAFTAHAEQESIAVAAAAGVMARFRDDRMPKPPGGSRVGSRAQSESGRSQGSRASRMSKMSKSSRMSKMSKASKASKASKGSKASQGPGRQRALLEAKARAAGETSSKAGSRASRMDGRSEAGRSKASKASRGGASSASSKGGKSTKTSRLLDEATRAEREEREELDRLEAEEDAKEALLAELQRIMAPPKEEDFSHSETDEDAELEEQIEEEEEAKSVKSINSGPARSRVGTPFGNSLKVPVPPVGGARHSSKGS